MATIHSSALAERGLAACPPALRDLAHWPAVDASQLDSPTQRLRYERLCNATQLYLSGHALKDVAAAAHLCPRRFHRLFARALQLHPDGRINGCRAFVARKRLKRSRRTAPRRAGNHATGGYSGLFGKLLADRPRIEKRLVDALCRRGRDRVQPNRLHFRGLHRLFLSICEEEGVGADDYPRNTRTRAASPLRKWLREDFMSRHAAAWLTRESGPAAGQSAAYAEGDGSSSRIAPPYSVWQLDEASIDLLARYELPTADGDWDELDLPRFVVIRVIDVGSSANLAWSLVLAAQASADDLIAVLWDAIAGAPPVPPVLPGLAYREGAGYPAQVIQTLRFAVPKVIYLDNALSHLAASVQALVMGLWGAVVKLGRPGTPQERGAIEARIGITARRLLHQMPATTGSGPEDPLRRSAQCQVSDRLRVDELEHAMDVDIANENSLPAAAARYTAPLERLRRQVSAGALDPLYLPAHKRRAHYFFKGKQVTVRADLRSGRRPFIHYLGVRYSSQSLGRSFGMVGRKMIVRQDRRDLRTLLLFDVGGEEVGPIQALGRWGRFPHDIRIRKLYLRLKREAELGEHAEDAPLDALVAHLRRRAPRNRQAALQLTHLLHYLQTMLDGPDGARLGDEYRELQSAIAASQVLPVNPVRASAEFPKLVQGAAPPPPEPTSAQILDLGLNRMPRRRVRR